MQQMVSGSPRLCPAKRQQFSRTCSNESKRLRKLADEGRNQAPSPQRGGCRTCLDRRAEARRGAANASCRMYCRESSRAISWPTKPGNGKQLDHLVLVPHGKLATLRFHLEEDAPSGQSPDRGSR